MANLNDTIMSGSDNVAQSQQPTFSSFNCVLLQARDKPQENGEQLEQRDRTVCSGSEGSLANVDEHSSEYETDAETYDGSDEDEGPKVPLLSQQTSESRANDFKTAEEIVGKCENSDAMKVHFRFSQEKIDCCRSMLYRVKDVLVDLDLYSKRAEQYAHCYEITLASRNEVAVEDCDEDLSILDRMERGERVGIVSMQHIHVVFRTLFRNHHQPGDDHRFECKYI